MNNNENLQSPQEENQAARALPQAQAQGQGQAAASAPQQDYSKETNEEKIRRVMYEKGMEQKKAKEGEAQAKAKEGEEEEQGLAKFKGIKGWSIQILRGAWGWVFGCVSTVAGAFLAILGLLYLNFHGIAKYLVGSDLFCDYGDEINFGSSSKAKKAALKIGEGIVIALLDIFIVFLIILTLLPFLVIIIFISNPTLFLDIALDLLR
jgi:hypothetical protein